MNLTLATVTGWFTNPVAYAVTGSIAVILTLVWIVMLTRRPHPTEPDKQPREKMSLENKLTFLVAVIIAGISAQGMGKFFYDEDKLGFPLELVIVIGGVLELTAFTCALRARRNIRDPKIGKAGVDGIAVWVVTAMSGVFAAMEADKTEVRLFRLAMPLLAAWLWERGMAIERRRIRGGASIHWRLTPERVLVWLRIAEPTGRTASEVDAHRRLTRVAMAAARVRALRAAGETGRKLTRAQRRLERATRAAVAHAGLAQDPDRQRALIAQLGSLYHADALADLTPHAPWGEFAEPTQTWFEKVQGVPLAPVAFEPRQALAAPVSDLSDGPETRNAADRSETRSQTPPRPSTSDRSGRQVPDLPVQEVPDLPVQEVSDPRADQVSDLSTPLGADRSGQKVSTPTLDPDLDPDPVRSRTRSADKVSDQPKRTRSRKQTRRPKALDRLDEAIAADRAYLAEHGRHIPAEKLARALSIGKPAALELVKQVRGGHIDVAK